MSCEAPQWHEMSTAETRVVSVDMSASLDDGELLTGTPSIQCSDDITVTDPQVNSSALTINDATVEAGRAVQFKVSCTVPEDYRLEIVCNTDAGQTVEGAIRLLVSDSEF